MRKYNQEIKDIKIIEEILFSTNICRLAMIDDNMPYLLPFNYGYKNKTVYIHSAKEGRKIDVLKKNPKVCFEIESDAEIIKSKKACNWSTKYRSIIGYGTVEFIKDFNEKRAALDIIMLHNGADFELDYADKQIDAVTILKLNIDSLTAKQSNNWDKIEKENPKPNDCENMDQIRSGIDRIDEQIVKLLSERSKYVNNAAKFKSSEKAVRDDKRVEKVIASKMELAKQYDVSEILIEKLYRTMINHFIDEEMNEWKK